MQSTLRKALIDSHVAAITIAILLLSSVEDIYATVDYLLNRLILFIQLSRSHQLLDLSILFPRRDPYPLPILLSCVVYLAANISCAWLLSQWTYGVGPLRCLASYRDNITRKFHA